MMFKFQYLSLVRFGSKSYENALLSKNALRRWEERKPEIVRSLSNIGPMRKCVPRTMTGVEITPLTKS